MLRVVIEPSLLAVSTFLRARRVTHSAHSLATHIVDESFSHRILGVDKQLGGNPGEHNVDSAGPLDDATGLIWES